MHAADSCYVQIADNDKYGGIEQRLEEYTLPVPIVICFNSSRARQHYIFRVVCCIFRNHDTHRTDTHRSVNGQIDFH